LELTRQQVLLRLYSGSIQALEALSRLYRSTLGTHPPAGSIEALFRLYSGS
jgi:hypothetical protein